MIYLFFLMKERFSHIIFYMLYERKQQPSTERKGTKSKAAENGLTYRDDLNIYIPFFAIKNNRFSSLFVIPPSKQGKKI
jgi:hypothetical protein